MPMTDRAGIADYIIIGGGPAGCVLANRLSADTDVRVLLLEAGGSDRHPLFHMPAGFAKMTKGIASWGWSTVPQKHLAGRVLWYTQGKVIGGGSSINAQVYTRGNRRDYDGWGIPGWRYAEVLPYFKRAEDNQRFADLYHGYGGPLGVSASVNPLPVSEAFLRAAQEMGIPYNPDFNGRHQAGIGHYQVTVREALLRRDRLSEADPPSPQSDGQDRRDRSPGPDRGRARHRRRARGFHFAGRAGSPAHRRRHRLAAAIAAVRHRPGGSPEIGRRTGGARFAGCRIQPPGPSRSLCHRRMHRRP
jgi:choline dehydrogenase-like flavoprotein